MSAELCRRQSLRLFCIAFGALLMAGPGGSAHAAKCPGHNSLEISDVPFRIAYESWKEVKEGFVNYGRCVETLNDHTANIDWIGARLKGIVAPETPQKFEITYLVNSDELRPSELRYGDDPSPERSKQVNFIANVAESSNAMTAARVTAARIDTTNGLTVPDAVLNSKSHAEINFLVPEVERIYQMIIDFTSKLDTGATFDYRLKYEINSIGGIEPLHDVVYLRATDPYLQSVLEFSGFETGAIGLKRPKDEFQFSIKVPTDNPNRKTTQATSAIDVLVNDKVVARFPIAFYAPY